LDDVTFEIPEDGATDLGDVSESDKSADVYLGHDADNFYLEVVAEDDTHVGIGGAGMWEGDTVQFAFAADGRDTYGPDYALTHVDGSGDMVQYESGIVIQWSPTDGARKR